MKNTFGNTISVTLFGESHGPCIGAVLDGLPAGFAIDLEQLDAWMDKRKARGSLSTKRQEEDRVHIVSGFFEGKTTGTALTLLIENKNQRSSDYAALKNRLRPSHADWAAFEKYDGFQDYRGGGHFSGRLTAPIVAAGAICAQILQSKGVQIASHILSLHGIQDEAFASDPLKLAVQMEKANASLFAVLDDEKASEMVACIEEAAKNLDSVGGILETAVTGLPAGLGEPFFDSVESILSHLLFSIPAIKGVSFGDGFGFASLYGSQANDPLAVENGTIRSETNRNGGINGGITNGMPLRYTCCVKPTPSIYQKQKSVEYDSRKPVELAIHGRHDPAIIHRARVVVDAMSAIGLLDLWIQREGVLAFQRGELHDC